MRQNEVDAAFNNFNREIFNNTTGQDCRDIF